MSVAIFTITHVHFTPPEDKIYVPLQVGRALHPDYGYTGDDTGDNISGKNPLYSELTGLYWIWKNYSDADYLGLCHYRRYFLNADGKLMTETEYTDILSRYDVIISQSRLGPYDYRTIYGRSHDIRNLELTEKVISEQHPEYLPDFHNAMSDNHCYVGNLFVAPRKYFNDYCEWLFSIFFAMEPYIDTAGYDDYHKRLFGFLSEQLLIVWIKHNGLSYYESNFGLLQEKAETITLKKILNEDFAHGDFKSAYRHLDNTLNKRPDLLLEMSDFNQELKTTEHIINICRMEEEAELPLFLSLSNDLGILIKHFVLLRSIIARISDGTVSEEELSYLIDSKVTYKALIYIMQNFPDTAPNPLELLNQLAVIYYNGGNFIYVLSFLEEAIALDETNRNTLSNIAATFRAIGEEETAAEYERLLSDTDAAAFTAASCAPSVSSCVHASARRIAVFTGSDIPILDYISGQYISALDSLGHIVYQFDKREFEVSLEGLFLFQKDGLDAVVVFNNACFQMRLQSGKSLWDEWDVPCFNILVDHPVYYFDTLDNAPQKGVVVCADRYHTDYIKRFYPTVKNAVFLPTAAACLSGWQDLKSFTDRPIDVLFIGSYKYHDDVIYDEFDIQLEKELLAHPFKTYEQAVEDLLNKNKILSADTNEALKQFMQKHRFIDVNVMAHFRLAILKELVEHGIPVTVYGYGWESLPISQNPNFHYRGIIAPKEGICLMEESKIVLNQLAWFKAGSSERIYEAMLQGAVALTDGSEYLAEEYTDGTDIRLYSLEELEKLPEIVHDILNNTEKTNRLRYQAYQKASRQDTWLQRAVALLDYVQTGF